MVFLILFLILIILLVLSKIQIEIENLRFFAHPNETQNIIQTSRFNDKYSIKIKLLILSKLPIISLKINKTKLQKAKANSKYQKRLKKIKSKLMSFNAKKINTANTENINKKELLKEVKEIIKQIDIQIKKFYLRFEIGTESSFFTSMLIPTISSTISIFLARKNVEKKNLNFEIKPIYNSREFNKSFIFRYI